MNVKKQLVNADTNEARESAQTAAKVWVGRGRDRIVILVNRDGREIGRVVTNPDNGLPIVLEDYPDKQG